MGKNIIKYYNVIMLKMLFFILQYEDDCIKQKNAFKSGGTCIHWSEMP